MASAERVLAGVVVCFIGAVAAAVALRPASKTAPAVDTMAATDTIFEMDTAPVPHRTAEEQAALRRRIDYAAPNTYIGDVITNHDSSIMRWPDDRRELRVWVQPQSTVRGFEPYLAERARVGFRSWNGLQPVTFTFVNDSVEADVPVVWVERFPDGNRIGVTEIISADDSLVHATVTLAMYAPNGAPVPESLISTAALHEAGHVLGLPHTADSTSVMYFSSAIPLLSERDKATVRLLYALPIGSVR